jgi:hypothetical protein
LLAAAPAIFTSASVKSQEVAHLALQDNNACVALSVSPPNLSKGETTDVLSNT